jgi:phosphopentomutase
MKRVIWIVLDSVGIGQMPDARKYGDEGSNTLKNTYEHFTCQIGNLQKLGIGNIDGVDFINKNDHFSTAVMRAGFISQGKDTITGHWEMAGVILDKPFKTYKKFDEKFIRKFEEKIGRKVIGNKVASGTEIIKELGEEQIRTGSIIVYTSSDSVFQIAAHENVVPVSELYDICKIARKMLNKHYNIARVIARPFIGEAGNFIRTANRKDFSVQPPVKTALEILDENGIDVYAIGKIEDIFQGRGIKHSIHTINNNDGIDKIIEHMHSVKEKNALIYANLVDFDMKYGHRNDAQGYAEALSEFDFRLTEILSLLLNEDILVICADHGCDPTTKSTDHSREYVPVIICGNFIKQVNLGTIQSISDLGATIADYLANTNTIYGHSFLNKIIKT